MKTFPLDEVLTISTGRLVAQRHMAAVYDLENYITSDNLTTIGLARVADKCKKWVLRFYPELEDVDISLLDTFVEDQGKGNESVACKSWITSEQKRLKLPDTFMIWPLPKGKHEKLDPYTEAIEIGVTPDKIVQVAGDLDENEMSRLVEFIKRKGKNENQ